MNFEIESGIPNIGVGDADATYKYLEKYLTDNMPKVVRNLKFSYDKKNKTFKSSCTFDAKDMKDIHFIEFKTLKFPNVDKDGNVKYSELEKSLLDIGFTKKINIDGSNLRSIFFLFGDII